MSKEELFTELNETLLEIKELVNGGGIISLALLNYKIDWASQYTMMLME